MIRIRTEIYDSSPSNKPEPSHGDPQTEIKESSAPGNNIHDRNYLNESVNNSESVAEAFANEWHEYIDELETYLEKIKIEQKIRNGELPTWSDIKSIPSIPSRIKELGTYSGMIVGSGLAIGSLGVTTVTTASIVGVAGITLFSAPIILAAGVTGILVVLSGGSGQNSITEIPRYLHPVGLVTTTISHMNGETAKTAHANGEYIESIYEYSRLLNKSSHEWSVSDKYNSIELPASIINTEEDTNLLP